jgi:nicotinate-nucleotide pyrophosphorylase (carboxylating)
MSTMPDYTQQIDDLIRLALLEDIRSGDITTNAIYSGNEMASARFIAKQDGIVAGMDVALRVAKLVDKNLTISWDEPVSDDHKSVSPVDVLSNTSGEMKANSGGQSSDSRAHQTTKFHYPDGYRFKRGEVVARIHGPANSLLTAERTMLNFMQRMSGIATRVREYVEIVSHTGTIILDTRKTLPGHRITDKMAVLIGGGQNHRFGLYDRYLIKENHIAVAGGIENAIRACVNHRKKNDNSTEIEIEVTSLDQLQEVLKFPEVTYVMLDNMDIETMQKAVLINRECSKPKKLEASGNVGLHNVATIAETGVDYISIGSITHSVNALDISLLFD